MNSLQKAILRTLAYADIFDYPLTSEEICRFLIGPKTKNTEIKKELTKILLQIEAQQNFYFLKGRKEIVPIRERREKWSQEKLKIAERATKWFRLIPTINMVGVTGALAMRNPDEDDDIDLLIITSQNWLWLTRLLTVFLMELVAKRRRPKDKKFKNKICLNMFLDEEHLALPEKEQDLFSAHEVCQLMPLWEKNSTYQKFINKNRWVKQFLPNWRP